ncbi:hypothetical protein [Streptomyces sp. E5N91]|uniref:hypothetical protein n=1 Tax=Streptomyces sp. E5N91 TaxID=1851996 RepID=UPI001EE81E34|nr:hypothetical protein [Streptomyces sp. E5N91]
MTRMDPAWNEARHDAGHSGGRTVAGPAGALTMLAGALLCALVGGVLIVAHVGTVTTAGAFFGAHMAVQGVLQLLAVHESGAPRAVRRPLFAAGVAALLLGAALFHGWADTVFLLGLWTGCGWLLRGITMAISVTSPSAPRVFAHDDLLAAAIVSAGLFMTAFPFSSLGQLTHVGGSALLATGVVEAVAAARRHARTLRTID